MTHQLFGALAIAGALALPVWADNAGRCDFHGSKPVAEATLLACADQRKQALIGAGKLERSWQTVTHEKLQAVEGEKDKECKLTFRNPSATDPAKARLDLRFTLPGNLIAANHTGE